MQNLKFTSKLPQTGGSIFSEMTKLALEHEAINLAQGFPNFDCAEKLKSLLYKATKDHKNQYAPMPGILPLRQAIANKIGKTYNKEINPSTQVCVTAGATQALFTLFTTFVHSGDEVIIFEPAYDSYRPSIELLGGKVVPFVLRPPSFAIDWDAVESLVSSRTKMIVINNPHNPLGVCYTKEDLLRLQALCETYDLICIGDEVYEHLVFDGKTHESILAYDQLAARSVVVYSFGKTFHITGWKMGYCVGAPRLLEEFKKVHQFNVFSVHTPSQYAIAEFLKEEEWRGLSSLFEAKRDLFVENMKQSSLEIIPSAGTYFCLGDYSSVYEGKDTEFARWLTREKGVAVIPISVFVEEEYDYKLCRFCFAKTDALLLEATHKLQGL